MGAPKPTGIPLALTSIIAPQDEPDFLILNKYFSHSFTIDLSGQKNAFFLITLSSHFFDNCLLKNLKYPANYQSLEIEFLIQQALEYSHN